MFQIKYLQTIVIAAERQKPIANRASIKAITIKVSKFALGSPEKITAMIETVLTYIGTKAPRTYKRDWEHASSRLKECQSGVNLIHTIMNKPTTTFQAAKDEFKRIVTLITIEKRAGVSSDCLTKFMVAIVFLRNFLCELIRAHYGFSNAVKLPGLRVGFEFLFNSCKANFIHVTEFECKSTMQATFDQFKNDACFSLREETLGRIFKMLAEYRGRLDPSFLDVFLWRLTHLIKTRRADEGHWKVMLNMVEKMSVEAVNYENATPDKSIDVFAQVWGLLEVQVELSQFSVVTLSPKWDRWMGTLFSGDAESILSEVWLATQEAYQIATPDDDLMHEHEASRYAECNVLKLPYLSAVHGSKYGLSVIQANYQATKRLRSSNPPWRLELE